MDRALWAVVVAAFALVMMTTMGSVHPAIRRDEQHDPGVAATNFGVMTPMGGLVGHIVYGIARCRYADLPISE